MLTEPITPKIKLKDDLVVIRPYAIGFVVIGVAALVVVAVAALVGDAVIVAIAINAASVISFGVMGYLLLLAKAIEAANRQIEAADEQHELIHQTNGRLEELLKSVERVGFLSGKKEGREEVIKEIENMNRKSI